MVAFIFKGQYLDIMHCCIATDSFRVVVQVVQDVPANVEIKWVFGCPERQHPSGELEMVIRYSLNSHL